MKLEFSRLEQENADLNKNILSLKAHAEEKQSMENTHEELLIKLRQAQSQATEMKQLKEAIQKEVSFLSLFCRLCIFGQNFIKKNGIEFQQKRDNKKCK